MTDIVERLRATSMHAQWPDEYPRSLVDEAASEIERLRSALAAEREACAAFAYAKYDWPPRWIAAALRGESIALSPPLLEQGRDRG